MLAKARVRSNLVNLNEYEVIQQINQGAFGNIFLIKKKGTEEPLVAKINVARSSATTEEEKYTQLTLLVKEISILLRIRGPTIIKFFGFSPTDFDGNHNITILMEYKENGSLADQIEKEQKCQASHMYNNTTKQIILCGIAHGMMILHSKGICHRDLKPENILLDSEFKPCITDFGLSQHFQSPNKPQDQNILVGTPMYFAPELLENSQFSNKSDVYAFGLLMWETISGTKLQTFFENKFSTDQFSSYEIMESLTEGLRPDFTFPINPRLQELIEQCWSSDPNKRPTFDEIFDKLSLDEQDDGIESELYCVLSENPTEENENESDYSSYCLDDVDTDKVFEYVDEIRSVSYEKSNSSRLLKSEKQKSDNIKKQPQKTNDPTQIVKERVIETEKKKEEKAGQINQQQEEIEVTQIEKDRIIEIEKKKDEEIEQIKLQNLEEIGRIKQQKEEEIETMKRQLNEEIERMKKQENEIQEFKRQKELEIDMMKRQKEEEIEKMKRENESEIERMKRQEQEIEQLRREKALYEEMMKANTEKAEKKNEQSKSPCVTDSINFCQNEFPDIFVDINNYEKVEGGKLGSGAFADVYTIREKSTNNIYAIKISHLDLQYKNNIRRELHQLNNEIRALKSFHHAAILRFIGFSPVDFQNELRPSIITDCHSKGKLTKFIENGILDDTQKLIILYGIASGMEFLHSHKHIHRDLKPDNILMNDNLCPIICDFGLSKSIGVDCEASQSTICAKGTPLYMAPEIHLIKPGKDSSNVYNESVDVYAFGMLMFELVTNTKPYEGKSIPEIQNLVTKGKKPVYPKNFNQFHYRKLIERCLDRNARKRPSFSEIVDILKNDSLFLQGIDTERYKSYIKSVEEYGAQFNITTEKLQFDNFVAFQNRKQTSDGTVLPPRFTQMFLEATGDKDKMFRLGMNFLEGKEDFPHNHKYGTNCLKNAADLGHIEAIVSYAKQMKHDKQYDESILYYKKGAELGNSFAQYKYGKHLYRSQASQEDKDRGLKYLKKSMSQGNSRAEFFYQQILNQ